MLYNPAVAPSKLRNACIWTSTAFYNSLMPIDELAILLGRINAAQVLIDLAFDILELLRG